MRHGYQQRMRTDEVRRDLGEILAHGEPERGRGQGEAAEQPAEEPASEPTQARSENRGENGTQPREYDHAQGNGVVVVDFGGNDPEAA